MVERTVQLAAKVAYPVKLVWTREEDIQHDMVRPAYVDRISGRLDKPGRRLVGAPHRGFLGDGAPAGRQVWRRG
jgi:CO/xanthine dehydrogenase Mo-binding subunit